MSATSSWMPGGQPSTTQPIAGPWLSPQVVMRNRWPKLLCDMGASYARMSLLCHYPAEPLLLSHGNVGRVLRLHADHMVAGVDMQDLPGHAAPEVRQQIKRAGPHILDGDRAPERGVVLVPFQDIAEIGDARGGERLDRACRDG